MRVLLVDDNKVERKVLARMLDALGHEVVQSCNGVDALERLEQEQVDVVVMDLLMPVLNGLETMEQLRKQARNCHTPVIVLSSAGDEVAVDCLQAGATAYLAKPCTAQELARELTRGCRGACRKSPVNHG